MVWWFLLVGCGRVDPAPSDLDGLSHWFLTGYDGADDAAVAEAVENLWVAADADALDAPIDGALTDLSADEVAGLELVDGTDPALGAGIFFARTIACPLDRIEQIVTALNQDELYVGVYDAYDRAYTSDADAYFARTAPSVSWTVEIDSELLGAPYHESLRGGARYIGGLPAEDAPHGPILMSRTHMPVPSTFEEGSSKSFDQDYQIEVYVEREPGVTVHLYALWRQLDMGSGLDQDNESVMRIVLNNLADWDDGTEQICAGEAP